MLKIENILCECEVKQQNRWFNENGAEIDCGNNCSKDWLVVKALRRQKVYVEKVGKKVELNDKKCSKN